ncbi:MAG: hypothetical protein ACR2M4_11400 [Actinomycetota bacterium]
MSARIVRSAHVIIHRALKDAVKWGKLARNVSDLADPPSVPRAEMSVWTAEELRVFLKFVGTNAMYPAFLLASTTGMRQGEILGLRWKDVDGPAARLSVRQAIQWRVQTGRYCC